MTTVLPTQKNILLTENGEQIYLGDPSQKTSGKSKLPLHIKRIGSSLALADTGEQCMLGVTPFQVRLDVTKLGLDRGMQPLLSQLVSDAARQYNLLPHMRYKKSRYGVDNAHGTFPKEFVHRGRYMFQSKGGVAPADAIMALFRSSAEVFITECSIGIQVISYKALLDFLGPTQFNQLFAKTGLVLQQKMTPDNPLLPLRETLNPDWQSIAKNPNSVFCRAAKGDLFYLTNISYYRTRHPSGDSPGVNVIYVGVNENGQPLLAGLFTDKKIHHYDEIIDHLVEDYNKVPFEAESYPA